MFCEPEICESWRDELALLQGNLSFMSFDSDESRDLNKLLSAFLYAAYVQNIPLLIAGPYAHEFADAVSLSVAGRYAGILTLDGRCDADIIKQLETSGDTVIVIQNTQCQEFLQGNPFVQLKQQRAKLQIETLNLCSSNQS